MNKKIFTKHLRPLALLCLIFLGITNAWGDETATLSFTKACGGSGTDDKSNSWTITSDAAESTFDSDRGIHYGTGSKAVSHLTLTSGSFSKKITKIVVNASDGNSTAKIDVTVGGVTFGSQSSTLTGSNAAYTFTPTTEQASTSFTGAVVVTISRSSVKKALYCKSIEVSYSTSDPSCSVSPTSIDFGTVTQGGTVDAKNVTVTLANTTYAAATLSGTNADAFEITAGEELTETGTVTVRPKAATLSTVGTYSASLDVEADGVTGTKSVTLSLKVKEPAKAYDVTHNFSEISGFSGWGSGYSEKIVNYTNDRIIFASANKSTSEITDIPVTKGGNVELILTNKKKMISAVKFNCRQWTTKTQTITLKYSTDKGNTYDTLDPSVTSSNFEISCDELPENTDAVQISFSSTSNQVGIESVSYNTSNKVLPSSAVNFTAPTNGSMVVKANETTLSSGSTVEQYDSVLVTLTPNYGYKPDQVSVVDASSNVISTTKVDENNYKFEMPASDVTITSTFAAAKILNSVEITKSATKTEFWKGETFSSAGLELTAHFSTGDEVVTPTSFTGYNMSTVGNQTVTVSYTEGLVTKTADYQITVKSIVNTKETAYTTAEAIAIIDANPSELTTDSVYVKGTVSKVESFNSTYKSITYWLDSDAFEIYSGKGIDGAEFSSKDDIAVNAQVVVKGIIKKYSSTYEMDKNNQLVSYSAPTKTNPTITATYKTKMSTTDPDDVYTVETETDGAMRVSSYVTTVALAEYNSSTRQVTINPVGVGTTTITISFDATDTYYAAEKSYTLTVTEPYSKDDYYAIVSKYDGKYYAMGSTLDNSTLNAVEVYSVNNKVITTSANPDTISWKKNSDNTVQNADGKYLSFSDAKISLSNSSTFKFTEGNDDNGSYWYNSTRAFIYKGGTGFKSYAMSNAGTKGYGTLGYNMTFSDGYTRVVTKGNWGTICLPNEINAADMAGAKFYSITGKKTKTDGETPESIILTEETGNLVAGRPYFFKATADTLVVAYSSTSTETSGDYNGLFGSLYGTAGVNIGYYILSNNKLLKVDTDNFICGANRAYVVFSSINDVPSAKGDVEIAIDSSTGIEEISLSAILSQGKDAYNVSGQKVGANYKGIVIVNGKKYINK